MGAEELQLFQRLMATANVKHEGNLSILKSGTLWRISFSTPTSKEDVDAMPSGHTFAEAAHNALTAEAKQA